MVAHSFLCHSGLMLFVLYAIFQLARPRSIDQVILEAEQKQGALSKSLPPPVVWHQYEVKGRNDTFVKVQLDMVITGKMYDQLVESTFDLKKIRQRRNALSDPARKWPKRVPYLIDKALPLHHQHVILQAIHHLMQYTCLTFVEATDDDYSYIIFSGNSDGLCDSHVGMILGPQAIRLDHECMQREVIIHEICHALGLFHEHMRTNRDNYVTINYANINKENHYNFDKLRDDQMHSDYGKPYDYYSIMHYGKSFYSLNKADERFTIVPKNESYLEIIGNALKLSFLDTKIINQMYNCSAGCVSKPCPDDGYLGKDCECYCEDITMREPYVKCKEVMCPELGINSTIFEVFKKVDGELVVFDISRKVPLPSGTVVYVDRKDRYCDNITNFTCSSENWVGKLPDCDSGYCRMADDWFDMFNITYLFDENNVKDNVFVPDGEKVKLNCLISSNISTVLSCSNASWVDIGKIPQCPSDENCTVKDYTEENFSLYFNNTVLTSGTVILPLTKVTIMCNDGHLEEDYDEEFHLTCLNGNFNGSAPNHCRPPRKECPLIVNATVIGSFMQGYQVKCIDGYEMDGLGQVVPRFKCSWDGIWEPLTPLCRPGDCVLPELTNGMVYLEPNGTSHLSGIEKVKHESQVMLSCPRGFVPDEMLISCNFAKFSMEFPTCQKVECPNPPVQNVTFEPKKQTYIYKDTVSINDCKHALEFVGEKKITCQRNGSWSGKALCQDYCKNGSVNYEIFKQRIIKNPKKSIRVGNFNACMERCDAEEGFLCMVFVFGFDKVGYPRCLLYPQDKNPIAHPELLEEKPSTIWTVAAKKCI